MIVVDTNILAYLMIPGPMQRSAEAALARDPSWQAPWLWRHEFRNFLLLVVRRGTRDLDGAGGLMARARALLADSEHDVATRSVLALALRSGCTAYDCEYVALAEALGVPLVTCDRQVLRAFPGVAVSLEAFVSTGGGGSARRGRARRP